MNWTVSLASPALKEVRKFPLKDQHEIREAFREMEKSPLSGDVLKLQGHGGAWRRRVGNYRIFFFMDSPNRTIYVRAVVRRTSTTY